MLSLTKKIVDKIVINKCKRDVCKCYNRMKIKKDSLTLHDTKVYHECFNCEINQNATKIQNLITDVTNDRDYPPLL